MTDTNSGIWDFSNYRLMWEPMACMICGNITHWVELNFQGPCHPGPCDRQLWAAYDEANRRAGPITGF